MRNYASMAPAGSLALRMIYGVLTVTILALSLARFFMSEPKLRTRSSTIALGMGAKSLAFTVYHLTTSHVPAMRRWASRKAYFVLDIIDQVAWGAVIFLVAQSNIQASIKGIDAILGWLVFAIAVLLFLTASCLAWTSFVEWRTTKSSGLFRYGTQNEVNELSEDSAGNAPIKC